MNSPRQLALLWVLASTFFACSGQGVVTINVGSMRPTMIPNEKVLVDFTAYANGSPARGEIVVFRKPDDPNLMNIKRIIALEGDAILLKDGLVYLNNTPINEPYLLTPASTNVWWSVKTELTVPTKSVYVLGDNRRSSEDSRQFGVVPLANVVGRAIKIVKSPDSSRIGKTL